MIVHVDDYRPYGMSPVTHTMVAISLGEFDAGQRADWSNSFLIPYTIFRKEKIHTESAYADMDKVTQLLNAEFHGLLQRQRIRGALCGTRRTRSCKGLPIFDSW